MHILVVKVIGRRREEWHWKRERDVLRARWEVLVPIQIHGFSRKLNIQILWHLTEPLYFCIRIKIQKYRKKLKTQWHSNRAYIRPNIILEEYYHAWPLIPAWCCTPRALLSELQQAQVGEEDEGPPKHFRGVGLWMHFASGATWPREKAMLGAWIF